MAFLDFNRNDARLVLNFLRMNLRDKYMGSALGATWAVANPLLLLAVFTFVFGYVYKIRLPGAETTLSYAVWLIGGYGPWIATSEAIMAAALSLVTSAGMVKNMAFKTELLPVSAALTGLVPLLVSLVFLAILLVFDDNPPTWHALAVIPVVVLHFAFVIALGFFLSTITVFVRDVGFVLPNLLFVILFATPIFYPIESTPRIVQLVSAVNPFYIVPEGYRAALIYHRLPDLAGLAYVGAVTLVLGYFGLKVFRRVKGHFTGML